MRHAWFGNTQLPNISILRNAVKHEYCFNNLHNTKTAMQTVIQCLNDWYNFKKALSVATFRRNQ
jgi:hypothetical protein